MLNKIGITEPGTEKGVKSYDFNNEIRVILIVGES